MKSFNFVVTDLVNNASGELLAVSSDTHEYNTYHYTNKGLIDENRPEVHFFNRKADIKKIRPSKNKEAMIDKMNLEILKNNVGYMAFCLEQASDKLLCHIEKEGFPCPGDDEFCDLPKSMEYISNAGKSITKALNSYSNYLKLCMDHSVGLYSLSINRTDNFKQRIRF